MTLLRTRLTTALGVIGLSLAQAVFPADQEHNGPLTRSAQAQATGRLLVKWRSPAKAATESRTLARKASAITGLTLEPVAEAAGQFAVLQADTRSTVSLDAAARALEHSSDVEYASIEYVRKAHALTNDPLLNQQWYLLSAEAAATRTEAAWDVTQGNPAVVVAVLDTGVLFDHPDLGTVAAGGKLLAGYDFVSSVARANDGDGRDPSPTDPGDWVTVTEAQQAPFDEDCLSESGGAVDSSWHGTRVAGLVAARTNNAAGVAGSAYNTVVLPVRVLGKCGGVDSDIIDAMRWAAGLPVGTLPLNPTPAKVINLSLGGEGACTGAYQAAVNDVMAAGALVVASAGNEGGPVSAPANCQGVLGVAGLRHIGTKVGFSNLGPQVGIGAPGGNCVNTAPGSPCLYPIVVTTNSGTTSPALHAYATDPLNPNIGTSFSSPMVASAAALLRAVNGTLTPAQTTLLLKDTATPYPTNSAAPTCTIPTATSDPQDEECNCTTATCGAGMLNTGAAIAAAQRPLAVIQTSGSLAVDSTLNLNGTNSFGAAGRTLTTFQWSVVDVVGTAPVIAGASQAMTTLQLPGSTQFTLRLTITDDQGTQDTQDLALATAQVVPVPTPTPTPTPTPSPAPIMSKSGGGGGGAFGFEVLVLIALGGLARRTWRGSTCT